MIPICDCNGNRINTGTLDCAPKFGATEKIIAIPLVANDGTRNGILLSATLDDAYFAAKINETDSSKAWIVLPNMEEVESVRAEFVKQTFASGNSLPVKQGVKPFSAFVPEVGTDFIRESEGLACITFGVILVDGNGSIQGELSADGLTLYPIPVQRKSLSTTYVAATQTTVEGVTFNFEFSRNAYDGDIVMIASTDIFANVLELQGLLAVNGSNPTAIGLTGHSIDIAYNYGSAKNRSAVKGLLAASFQIFNQTSSSVVTIITVVESLSGTYTFTYAAQTASDVIETRVIADGYDDTQLRTITTTL